METTKTKIVIKKLFDKENRTNTLLGIAGWVSLALGVILFSFGLWTHFHSAGGPLTATYRDDTVYVEASYGKEAKIPGDAELRAALVAPEDDPDAYSQKMAAAMSAMGRDGETAPTNAIYHVGFYVGDQEVEPAAPVNVVVQVLQDGFAVGEPVKVVHLGEDDAEVIADTSVDDAGFISFTTDGFSDFVFVWGGSDSSDTSGTEDNGIVGMGRRWMGFAMRSAMRNGGFEVSGIEEPMAISDGPIDLNGLTDEQVDLTFQYMDENGIWQNVPEGGNIFDYYDSGISITFKFNRTFTQAELTQSNGTLTYDLPPYLKDFKPGESGVLLDQNRKVAGSVTVDENGKVIIQLTDDFIKENHSAEDLHFSLSGKVDLDKANKEEVGDKQYPGFNLVIPEDQREAHSQYGTLKLEKTCRFSAPQRGEDGDWYVDYTLVVTAPDYDMPDVRVEDIFDLTSDDENMQVRLKDLIEAYVKYSVEDDSMNLDVGKTPSETPNSVYQTGGEDGVPHLNWYLGDMNKGESRTLYYRVKLNKDKMETTNFTKDGVNLPNNAEAFSNDYPKDNADAKLPVKTYVNIHKENQGEFEPDGEGGGYLTYEVWVRNETDYPTEVKLYDSVNDPNANTNNNKPDKGKGLTYEKESFTFQPEQTDAGYRPNVEFSMDGDKYTSFTAHIGWLQPQEMVTVTYRIHVDAETLASGKVDVNNGVLALFEQQSKENDTYPTWLERYQQNHTIDQEQWAAKNYGGTVASGTKVTIPGTDTVYDATGTSVTASENPGSFTLGENSFQYTVTVNGNTVWDVSSATMGDHLTNGLHYTGYVRVVAKDKAGQVLKTTWVKVDGLNSFSFTGDAIGFGEYGAGTSYELTYYTTIDEENPNFHIVLENDFSMGGEIIGPGNKRIQVSVQDSTTNRAETSDHLKVTKDAWYYEPDGTDDLGAFYWIVKVDASYIPNGFALKDVAGEKHALRNDSLLGVYIGPEHEFGLDLDWNAFKSSAATDGFEEFNQYSSKYEEGKGLTVTFDKGDHTPAAGQYVYLFFKTQVTERQANPYENNVYSNGDNIPSTTVDYFEDNASNYLPGVGGVEKAGMQVFDWDGSTITFLNGNNNPNDYKLDNSILSEGEVQAGRYAAWSVSVNKTGSMQGDFTITDQIPAGMELSFVAIAKTVHILQTSTNNTPPWAILLPDKGEGESGLLVGHAKQNQSQYQTANSRWDDHEDWKPWNTDNWRYYPSENGRMVSWGVHIQDSMCIDKGTNKPFGAYEVDYLVVCRVTDPDVLLGVTKGDPQKTFNNHVTVRNDKDQPVANADADLTVPCKPVVTKSGVQAMEGGHLQQNIKFTLKVNEAAMTVEGEENLILKDVMSENLILVPDSVHFFSDPDCTEEMTEGVSFTSVGNVITFTIPNGKAVYIQYECQINAPAGPETPVENIVNFEGRKPDDQGGTWDSTVRYDSSGGISGSKKMQITKKDSLSGIKLPGAEFTVTLLGTTNESGVFEKSGDEATVQTLTTGENGISDSFTPTEGGLYRIEETKAPEGYVPDNTPRYYWIGKGTYAPPSVEDAGLSSDTKINAMYTGVIDIEILNERAKITVTKKFVNEDRNEILGGVEGTYTFGLFTKEGDSYQEAKTVYGEQKQTLTYPEDIEKVLTFYVPYNSETPVKYYILELDETGKPVESGSRFWIQTEVLGTVQFEPSYEYGTDDTVQNAASSENAETTVTVTNTCYTAYALPESGGPGTLFYLLTGLVLAVGSSVMLFTRRRLLRAQ